MTSKPRYLCERYKKLNSPVLNGRTLVNSDVMLRTHNSFSREKPGCCINNLSLSALSNLVTNPKMNIIINTPTLKVLNGVFKLRISSNGKDQNINPTIAISAIGVIASFTYRRQETIALPVKGLS